MPSENIRKKVVVLSGAGISAESGLKTFRDAGGLWEGHKVESVATPFAWENDPETVLRFYNERRRQLFTVHPNRAHLALVELEQWFDVTIVTQNVDDLHERAGSHHVLHLHGELDFARSSADASLIYKLNGKDIKRGDKCEKGSQLRPHIVWFGESVPMLEMAITVVTTADVLIVVGTSLAVYPAASLVHFAPPHAKRYVVNPEIPNTICADKFYCIHKNATVGIPLVIEEIRSFVFDS